LAARECVLATLELTDAIQEPSQRKAYLTRVRDSSWETAAERAFGFPITIDTEALRIEEGAVIPCCANFREDIPKSPNKRFVFVSVTPGQRAPITEVLRARLEEELNPKEMRISFTVCDGFSRYPIDLVVRTDLSWNQLVEAWYEKASVTPHWDAGKYPRDASAYETRDANNQPVTSMDGIDRIFAHYKSTTTVPPPKPSPATSTAPKGQKKIRTFVTAYPSGDTVELASVAKYDDSIPSARLMGGIPADWDRNK
jgi:hypothetical protein